MINNNYDENNDSHNKTTKRRIKSMYKRKFVLTTELKLFQRCPSLIMSYCHIYKNMQVYMCLSMLTSRFVRICCRPTKQKLQLILRLWLNKNKKWIDNIDIVRMWSMSLLFYKKHWLQSMLAFIQERWSVSLGTYKRPYSNEVKCKSKKLSVNSKFCRSPLVEGVHLQGKQTLFR